jgi:hypothetical protein
MAVFLDSPPASGENVEPSPFPIVNSTIPLPLSLQIRKINKYISCTKKKDAPMQSLLTRVEEIFHSILVHMLKYF